MTTLDPHANGSAPTEPAQLTLQYPEVPERVHFEGGGLREPQAGKPRFDLLLPALAPFDKQFLTRCARHMGQSLRKYPERNWEEFCDAAALERAKSSAFRHFMQWMAGDLDEDHAAAVFFNLMAAEYVRARIEGEF